MENINPSVLASAHCIVTNIFKGTINVKLLCPGLYWISDPSDIEELNTWVVAPYLRQSVTAFSLSRPGFSSRKSM
jgi:hypothetical protein